MTVSLGPAKEPPKEVMFAVMTFAAAVFPQAARLWRWISVMNTSSWNDAKPVQIEPEFKKICRRTYGLRYDELT